MLTQTPTFDLGMLKIYITAHQTVCFGTHGGKFTIVNWIAFNNYVMQANAPARERESIRDRETCPVCNERLKSVAAKMCKSCARRADHIRRRNQMTRRGLRPA